MPTKVEEKSILVTIEYPEIPIIIFQGNSLGLRNTLPIPETRLEARIEASGVILDCIIQLESGGNEKAYNPMDIDGFPRFGLLQFFMPTWENICVEKYGLEDDIWNGEIQKECYHLMVRDNMSSHWPTYNICN